MPFIILLIFEILILYLLARKINNKFFNFFYRLTKNAKISTYLFAFLFFPGTFIHEISHFLFALVLLVPVGKIELFPRFEEDEIKLGSVAIAKVDPIRRTLVGLSPIIFGINIILGSIYYVYQNNLLNKPIILIALAYLVFEIGNTMFSSKKDLEGVLPVVIVILALSVALYFLGLRITWEVNVEIIQKLNIFLAVPIIIDSLLLIF